MGKLHNDNWWSNSTEPPAIGNGRVYPLAYLLSLPNFLSNVDSKSTHLQTECMSILTQRVLSKDTNCNSNSVFHHPQSTFLSSVQMFFPLSFFIIYSSMNLYFVNGCAWFLIFHKSPWSSLLSPSSRHVQITKGQQFVPVVSHKPHFPQKLVSYSFQSATPIFLSNSY